VVPGRYLARLKTSEYLPVDDFFVLKHSKSFDLVESLDRKEYVRAFWSMMHYLRDGNPRIGKWR